MLRTVTLTISAALLWSAGLVDAQRVDAQPPAAAPPADAAVQQGAGEPIDFERARRLLQRRNRGDQLTLEEQDYLRRAIEARGARNRPAADRSLVTSEGRERTGLIPLSEMTADARYHGEDGGLYGQGENTPPDEHRKAAEAELARIEPLDSRGQPAADGQIVLVSISMSNATQEFSTFKRMADADPAKSEKLTIIDCAQGGQAMAQWTRPDARPWSVAERRIERAGATPAQVQIAWIKLANVAPRGELAKHGKQLQRDTTAVIQNAKMKFPNLRVVYLGSRIYGGYARSQLNPEPYAYESAFAVRWLFQDQIGGSEELNYDPQQGKVKAPLLLWGPYFWADGLTPRGADQLVWRREDFVADGTHPSTSGREKVAGQLLDFFKTDPLAKSWFSR